jgi:RNA polymerase sigma factor (sigma-70 family)
VGAQQESPVPDADLVRAALLGAREPFAELVRRHQRTATALAARVLGCEDLARDAVQEAAITAMTGLDRLRAADRFGPWFCGITLNIARRWAARLRPETWYGGPGVAVSNDVGPDVTGPNVAGRNVAGPAELAELADLGARVRSAIAGLADGQREAVLLFYLHGLSHREVAAQLGISVAAVKARLHQARATLAPRLASLADINLADINTEKGTSMTTRTDVPGWVDVSIAGVRRQGGEPGGREPGESLARKHVVVLDAGNEQGRLPIWVGPVEATALAMILESVETARPLTYQFAAGLLAAAGARATEVRITRLIDGIYYAVVVVDGPGGRGEVEARPSDAITLATITGVPIRVESGLLADSAVAVGDPKWEAYPAGTTEIAAEIEQWIRREQEQWEKREEPC